MLKRGAIWSPALAGLILAALGGLGCGAGVRRNPLGGTRADAQALMVEDLGTPADTASADGASDLVEAGQDAGSADAQPDVPDSESPPDAPEPSLDGAEPRLDGLMDVPAAPRAAGARCDADGECASGNCAGRCCESSSCQSEYNACNESGACRRRNGGACTQDSECHSSLCVDWHCCAVRSCAECTFCGGEDGTCTPMLAPPTGDYCGSRIACNEVGLCQKTVGQPCQNGGDCLSTQCQENSCGCVLCPSTEIVDFGAIWLGAKARARVIFRNASGVEQDLQIAGTGGLMGRFELVGDGCQRGPIQPGEVCALDIDFVPTKVGSQSGNIDLWGTAPTPAGRLSLRGAAVSIESPILTPTPHDFGSVPRGTSSAPVDFVLQNPFTGARFEVAPPVFVGRDAGAFLVVGSNCPSALNPGERCNITVVFRPPAAGPRVATLHATGATAALTGVGL
jgi:hypothetical protein